MVHTCHSSTQVAKQDNFKPEARLSYRDRIATNLAARVKQAERRNVL